MTDTPAEPIVCTCCTIREVEPPLFSGAAFAPMPEECDQHICNTCSRALAAAAARFLIFRNGEL